MDYLKFEDFKPGMIIKLYSMWTLYKSAAGSKDTFGSIDYENNLLVLANPTREFAYNSLKVLCNNKIGYISWQHSETVYCEIIK